MVLYYLDVYIDDFDSSKRLYYDGIFRGQSQDEKIIMTYDVGNETKNASIFRYLPDEGLSHKYQVFYKDDENNVSSAHHAAIFVYKSIMATYDLGNDNVEILKANRIKLPWRKIPGITEYNLPDVFFVPINPAVETKLQGIKRKIVKYLEENQHNLYCDEEMPSNSPETDSGDESTAPKRMRLNNEGPLTWPSWVQPTFMNIELDPYDNPRPGPSWMQDGVTNNGQGSFGTLRPGTPCMEPDSTTNAVPRPGTPFMPSAAIERGPEIYESEDGPSSSKRMRFDNDNPRPGCSWMPDRAIDGEHEALAAPRPGTPVMPSATIGDEPEIYAEPRPGTSFMPSAEIEKEPEIYAEPRPATPFMPSAATEDEPETCAEPRPGTPFMPPAAIEDEPKTYAVPRPGTPFMLPAVIKKKLAIYVPRPGTPLMPPSDIEDEPEI